MKRFYKTLLTCSVIAVLVAVATLASSAFAADDENWVSAWGTAPVQAQIDGLGEAGSIVGELIGDDSLTEVTVRTVITPTASGSKIRLKFSNHYNTNPVVINGVTIAKKGVKDSEIEKSTLKIVTFNDSYPSVTIAPGAEVYSDPIRFDVVAHQKIVITTFFDSFLDVNTMGVSGAETYLTTGDALQTDDFDMLKGVLDDEDMLDIMAGLLEGFGMGNGINLKFNYSFMKFIPCLVSADVLTHNSGYSVVVVGDSTVANDFPLYLGQALYEDENVTDVGVVGKGLPGNCLLYPGLGLGSYFYAESMTVRLKQDVLSQPGLKYVIVKVGVSDIIHPVCTDSVQNYPGMVQPSAKQLIEGFRRVFKACHDEGVKVIVIGITQWKDTTRDFFGDGGTYIRTPAEFEADWQIAKDVNAWLAATDEHDGFVDFCEVSANPRDPDAFLPEYSEDRINPSPALQKLWANRFPLSLIGAGSLPGGVYIESDDSVVFVDEEIQLKAVVYPETAENKQVEWYSQNPEIASVDENGNVRGVSNGVAVIGCKTEVGSYKAVYKVTVKTSTQGVILNYNTNSIFASEKFQLKATVYPETATDKSVVWSTDNSAVATVSSDGTVTGVGKGTAVITCTTADGGGEAFCTVTVKKKTHVQNIELSYGDEPNFTSKTLYKGQSFKLEASVSPEDATFKNVRWNSSDVNIATVDEFGRVTAVGGGKVTIRCTSVDNPMVSAACNVTVKVKATGISLSSTSLKLYEGKSKTITANILPEDATNKKVTWKSQNSKVAKVSKSGKITAVKAGTTYITATTANGLYTAKCKVTVSEIIYTKKITLSKSTLSIKDGKTATLTAKISPSNVTNKTLVWSSSDSKIAKVSQEGKITAVKPGTAYIYCKSADTGVTAKCKVTVKKVTPTSVSLSAETISISYGKTKTLKATVSPSNATDKTLTWTSSDPSVVKVYQSGKIKGLKAGKSAVITVTTNSGKKTAKITVKVTHVEPKGLALNKTSVSISKGGTVTLSPVFTPSNTSVKTVTWKSSNKKVATVSSSGVVKGVSNGTATITCKTKNGLTATCVVNVAVIQVSGVAIKESSGLMMQLGSSYRLTALVYPEQATNKKVVWMSSNESVATVSSSGVVTAKKPGACEIIVTTSDGGYRASCKVTVN